MTDENDRDLLQAFHALRRETAPGAPGFRATLSGLAARRDRRARARRRLTIIGALVGLVLLVLAGPFADRTRPVRLHVAARWEAPTDFLLRTPGAELLRTVPTFTINGRIIP
jgi:hypothetical protein